MRTEMREDILKEEKSLIMSERNKNADRLFEKWSKKDNGIGDGLTELRDLDENRARSLSIVLENQEQHLGKLTETQISNSFSTTPENVLRIVRLGYPNSVRGEIFMEWAMETARDSIYYLSPKYSSSLRGATAGNITHESSSFRYASEIESQDIGDANGTLIAFTGTLANHPLRPFAVTVYVNGVPKASDDGAGNLIGSDLDTTKTNTVNYTTGDITVSFSAAPTTGDIVVEYHYDSEDPTNYTDIGSVELQLKDYQFRVKPWPLYVSWSKMTELLLNTTLNIDAEDALIRGAADELKKSLDFQAVSMAYKYSKAQTAVEFNINGATGESTIDRMTAFNVAIDEASDKIYDKLQRGGVTKLVGGPSAVTKLKLHKRFDTSSAQEKVGIYREGTLDGIDVYKAPSSIVDTSEFLAVHKNPAVPEDVSVAFGSLIPLYKTQTQEFKQMYKELGMAYFGDAKVLQPDYLQRIKLVTS